MNIIFIALDIADESEAGLLKSTCFERHLDGLTWLDTSTEGEQEKLSGPAIRRAVDYLRQRGILMFHPKERHLVRLTVKPETLGAESRAPFEQ